MVFHSTSSGSNWQLEALTQSIAQLLVTLNKEYCAGQLLLAKTSTPLKNLHRYMGMMISDLHG
jgi:hypothetical protein